jgi:uncharacterized membrane protein
MKKSYPIVAFVCAALLQLFLWHRCARLSYIKDYTPPDSWYWQNVGLVTVTLLLIAPVIRHGVTWQRVVAGLLSVLPLVFVVGWFYYAFTELTEQ